MAEAPGEPRVSRSAAARTLLAARALGERIRTVAAALLEAHAADIELGAAAPRSRNPGAR